MALELSAEKDNVSACLVYMALLQKNITPKISAVLYEQHWVLTETMK